MSEWTTTAVSPLPAGWVNVYRLPHGKYESRPCPALLLQAHTMDEALTRVVPANVTEGRIYPARRDSNYVGTFGPEQPWLDPDTEVLLDPTTARPLHPQP